VDAALVKASGPDGDRVRKARPGEQDIAQSAITNYNVIERASANSGQTIFIPVSI
jgi:23S rRNA pseudouridine955/2504/2580 synthase